MQPNNSYTSKEFVADIAGMNYMYQLPIHNSPTIYAGPEEFQQKLADFHVTLRDEVNEIGEIIAESEHQSEVQILTNIADLLGDVVVYCFSEALKYGIPLMEVLEIIMDSNKSKLGADGEPIKNEQGKFMKGPNYWKPEPKIEALLMKYRNQNELTDILEASKVEYEQSFETILDNNPLAENRIAQELLAQPSKFVSEQSEAILHAHAELTPEPSLSISDVFTLGTLDLLDGDQFNKQLREHLTSHQIEVMAMSLAFNTATMYRAMGADGIARGYDALYSTYSGRGDKLEDFSCYVMWQFLAYPLDWKGICDKLVELKVYG